MKIYWKQMLALLLLLLPVAAVSVPEPQVTLAIPGTGDPHSGVVERFTLRFSEAMVPLGDPRATPPATSDCPVAATGRWIDTTTYVFDFERALPGGISCAVSLRDDLKTFGGAAVGGTQKFTIDTGGPSARAVLAGGLDDGIEEGQVFLVATNVAPDPRSVAAYGYCTVDGIGEKIALDVMTSGTAAQIIAGLGDNNWELRNFFENASLPAKLPASKADQAKAYQRVTAVKCRRPLPPGRDMALVWAAHIADGAGKQAGRDQRFDFSVRKAFTASFECPRVNARAGCNPVEDAYVRFAAPLPRETALAVRLKLADGRVLTPQASSDDKNAAQLSDIVFKGPFPEATAASIILPDGVKDISGRPLGNGGRFPLSVQFDHMPPLVKFAASFGIVEANEGGVLPVTVRAVEPQLAQRVRSIAGASLRIPTSDKDIAAWLRKLAAADDNDYRDEPDGKGATKPVNYTGATSLLGGKGTAMKLALPGGGKQFEVIGIPLAKPGFYVVELASPALGRALLGRDKPRYVAAGALVTNMAVHFKWGRASSLVWVTALDSGKPVSGANVRVTDSCSGALLAGGTSDAFGRVMVSSGLPDPETYGNCDGETHTLMASARSGDDYSFTLSQWGEGIRPYDFDLPYGWSAPDDIIHTIFDRTLIRAGETVNMKHILRRPVAGGFTLAGEMKGVLQLTHRGSDTQFELPLAIGKDGIGESKWTAPAGAPMGDYDLRFVVGTRTIFSAQSIRVDEFRLPTMQATITGPKQELVRPASVPLSLFVGYLSGGGAANLPVVLRT
ncbi:MAG: MG2 domain-containing protein, partial [Sphingobium sp.]